MQKPQILVAGYDMLTPLGTDLDSQWEAACLGKSGIGPLTRFELTEDFPVRIAGEVPEIDPSPYPFLKPRQMANWRSPVFKHGLLAVHRALERSGIEISKELAPRVAVTFSSAVGGQDAVLAADRRLQQENKMPHPFTNPNSCINMVAGKVAILTGATGPISCTNTACSTGSTSMIMGAMLLAAGRADVAICGAVDFVLVEPIVAGFASMNGAYRHRPEEAQEAPEKASRPFSAGRRGFVVSEGAGAVILVSREFAKAHQLQPELGIQGWSMTADAYHFVAPYEPTVRRCILESIQDAGLSAGDIAAVNAHAASTQVGDKVEYEALQAVFGTKLPALTANKSMTGHAMGASSAIESILAMQGMLEDTMLPSINYEPDPEMPLPAMVTQQEQLEQEFVLKNAFGFGGCNACMVFRRFS
ncbi:MAG: beta-ketoacyl-[acyl-carrier-protein] synthase family protein [Desulfohalobiaceae bacterium]